MLNYLIHAHGKGRFIEVGNISSDEYGEIQEQFATEAKGGPPANVYEKYAEMERLYPECVTSSGVPYTWGLAGPDGAWFQLIATPNTTEEQLRESKDQLRRERDVVRCSVLRIKEMI